MKAFPLRTIARGWLVAAAALALAACGGGSDNTATTGSSGQPSFSQGTQAGVEQLVNTAAATLTGAQETPATSSTAQGSGTVVVDPATRQMTATVTTRGVAGLNANIEVGVPGVPGPVLFPLAETGAGSGVWTTRVILTDAQLAALQAGSWYFNVHSAAFPNGEIRGQIVSQQGTSGGSTSGASLTGGTNVNGTVTGATGITLIAALRGAQEVPANTSTATGAGTVLVDSASRTLVAAITTAGINGTAAHINAGAPGVSGPLVFPLIEVTPGSGVWTLMVTLTDAQLAALQAGDWYFDVSSTNFPQGEIRGQILPLQRSLSGSGATTGTAGTSGNSGITGVTGSSNGAGIFGTGIGGIGGTGITGTTGTNTSGIGTIGIGTTGLGTAGTMSTGTTGTGTTGLTGTSIGGIGSIGTTGTGLTGSGTTSSLGPTLTPTGSSGIGTIGSTSTGGTFGIGTIDTTGTGTASPFVGSTSPVTGPTMTTTGTPVGTVTTVTP